jgi:NAD(P)-dependent dehydrogenase (short-subunit alcohol dehydrogenase family)
MTRTIFVTGATDGLGLAVAQGLAAEGHQLVLHGRRPDRLAQVAADIAARTSAPPPLTVVADLSELAQVHGLAEEVEGLVDRLDGFVSNAGIGAGAPDGVDRQVSADGHELRFAINYLAGFDLTQRLLPLLAASGAGRVVHVASLGQSAIDWDDVMIERDYSGGRAYGQSKLAQIIAGFELADRLGANPAVTVNSLHPATMMPTKMVIQGWGRTVDTLEEGEAATRRLASAADVEGVTGRFYDRLREARVGDASAYDPEVRRRLWELSLELTGAPDVL